MIRGTPDLDRRATLTIILAMVGAVCLLGGAVWGIIWLCHHVRFV